jgi:hypothetical protein
MSGNREATGLEHDGGRVPAGGAWQAERGFHGLTCGALA